MADDLTVIIVALLGGEALNLSVAAVGAQAKTLLVVQRDGRITDWFGEKVGATDRLDIPSKRRRAVELATTPLVALIEDTVIPEPHWASAIAEALSANGAVACGGPVRISGGLPATSRALALSEYGGFGNRKTNQQLSVLPGCNFAFRRDALLKAMDGEGLVDQKVFRELSKVGMLVWAPEMAVTYARANPEGARLRTRFDHGRIYGSAEGAHAGFARRIGKAGKAILLPPVLTLRSFRNAGPAERRSLPTLGWLALQHAAWAAGEFAGSIAGPSRKGLDEWR
jgi:hypothetical protein